MTKDARLSMRIDPQLKEDFFQVCNERQQVASKVIEHLIKQYVDKCRSDTKITKFVKNMNLPPAGASKDFGSLL